ncbi:formate dehydrogenase subunit gamma [[Pseudomonas] boreopolis]|uniref:Formate dehydrogenase cytochrome b556 (FDO) subunit n=1 Tax=Xanthomonas boreopolis TaxID=86183 RepID=A0A919KHJ6_9XANT|nr:formate dehydrogenase cytochrome b556 (FDO) subunit [[Pseudomonas] boreopolis]
MSHAPGDNEIVRYRAPTRINHWIVAISFVLVALSGLALFHPALFPLSALFGGGPWTRILHPFIGLVMVVAFALLAARMWRDNLLDRDDRSWLRGMRHVLRNEDDKLPPVGRFNAGQKLLFWSIVGCLLALLLSGLVIWRAYFSHYFPIGVIRFSVVVHALFGLVLVCAIVVHIYAAIWVKGSVKAMTRGKVSYGWAHKHHRAWFRQVLSGQRPKE